MRACVFVSAHRDVRQRMTVKVSSTKHYASRGFGQLLNEALGTSLPEAASGIAARTERAAGNGLRITLSALRKRATDLTDLPCTNSACAHIVQVYTHTPVESVTVCDSQINVLARHLQRATLTAMRFPVWLQSDDRRTRRCHRQSLALAASPLEAPGLAVRKVFDTRATASGC